MTPRTIAGNGFSLIVRAALLLIGVLTYLVSPDDVVWRFIKISPNARLWEHASFGVAAVLLGIALLLKVRSGVQPGVTASLLQDIGIGSLLPLPGFLVLVLGDLAANLFLYGRHSTAEADRAELASREEWTSLQTSPLQNYRWKDNLAPHIGLCCAAISMAIFSVVLIDRVADVLFAITALVSITANSRPYLRACFS
jgi:hypothetical protein